MNRESDGDFFLKSKENPIEIISNLISDMQKKFEIIENMPDNSSKQLHSIKNEYNYI